MKEIGFRGEGTVALKISNCYGNVDVRNGLPSKSYVHVRGERLQPLCRKLGINFAQALIGVRKSKYGHTPQFDGVVVSVRSGPKLLQAITEREERTSIRPERTPEQLQAAKARRQERDVAVFAAAIKERYPNCPEEEALIIAGHACHIGSGRVGRSRTADDPVGAAVIAHIRHTYTDYDDILDESYGLGYDREDREDAKRDARSQVWPEIVAKLQNWESTAEKSITDEAANESLSETG